MTQQYGNLIAGEQVGSSYVPNINPSDVGDIIGEFACADEIDVARAVDAAREAATLWGMSSPLVRHEILRKAAEEIRARSQELGDLLAREEGKTKVEAVGEAIRAAQIFDFFAGEALRLAGEILPSIRPGISVEITREPLGVVGLITPWNFPIAIPAWKLAPALAYGNAILLKPAELVPGCAWHLADILDRAGLPKGVLNLVMGEGRIVGQAMLEHEGIDGISFTGSEATGQRVAIESARHHRRYQLEMGGKNPLVVLDDADLDNAVECAINGAYFSTGQRCTASSRLIVTQGIHDQFLAKMQSRLMALQIGDARDEGSDIGPVVDQRQLDQDCNYIEIGKQEGASLAFGGDLVERPTKGFFLQPALFTNVTNSMRIAQEEIFGPVAGIIKVADYDESLAVANDTPFGLCAGICTKSLAHAADFKRRSQAGMVMVNLPTAGVDFHVPFGGRKRSSSGPREQGRYAREFYTQVKTAYVKA